jgi:malonate-semialdehyde dehydrogenase (acetylating)/methylmalonate-semialdehyde dehydrogenase
VLGLIDKGAGRRRESIGRRSQRISPGYERGNFVRPTVLTDVDPASELAKTEVFDLC